MEANISQLILEDREKRYNYILELSKKYNLPVVCGKLNYPGKNKNTMEADNVYKILRSIIEEKLGIETVFSIELEGYDGKSYLAVIDMPPENIKRITANMEDSMEIGRIFDIDVYINDGTSIGRELINQPPRKCIICGENARICVRSGKHSLQETLKKINQIINNYGDQYGNRL